MRARLAAVGFVVIVAGALMWWYVHRPTDREQLDGLIAKAEHGVETKSVSETLDCIAPDYQDPQGLSKTDVWRAAAHWMQSNDTADVSIDRYQVDITPPTATGQFEVRVLVTQNGKYIDLGPLRLTVEFEKERRRLGRVWLVKSVTGQGMDRLFQDVM